MSAPEDHYEPLPLTDDARQRQRLRELMLSVQAWEKSGRWSGPKLTYGDVRLLLNVTTKLETTIRCSVEALKTPLAGLP